MTETPDPYNYNLSRSQFGGLQLPHPGKTSYEAVASYHQAHKDYAAWEQKKAQGSTKA